MNTIHFFSDTEYLFEDITLSIALVITCYVIYIVAKEWIGDYKNSPTKETPQQMIEAYRHKQENRLYNGKRQKEILESIDNNIHKFSLLIMALEKVEASEKNSNYGTMGEAIKSSGRNKDFSTEQVGMIQIARESKIKLLDRTKTSNRHKSV